MQAKQLHEVLARVVAWHNRHPLALRISPHQVHSIGGVALPFASAVQSAGPTAPPALHEVLDPPATDAVDAFASFVAGADPAVVPEAAAHSGPVLANHALTAQPEPEPEPEPEPDTAAEPTLPLNAEIEAASDAAAAAAPEAAPEAQPEPAADAEPPAAPDTPDTPDPAAAADATAAAAQDAATPDDDAPIELAMALDEAAAQADAEAAASLAQESDAAAAGDDTPFTGTETQVLPAPDATGPGADGTAADVDPHAAAPAGLPADESADVSADVSADAPLAARLQAARERAMAGAAGADEAAGVDIALDGPTHAPAPPAQALGTSAALAAALTAAQAPRSWLARLWAGLPLGFMRRRGQAQTAAAGSGKGPAAGSQGKLAPLFSQDFMWPRTPRQVARWVQRHGAEAPLAPADWPQRQVETDAALLQAARRQGLPHAVTRHVLTAAIGVGDRRIRLLIDEQGQILGPRALDRRRIGLLGSGGAALAAGVLAAVLGPWRQAAPHADDEAAAQAQAAASAASAALAETAASAAMAAASAASDATATGEAAHAENAEHKAHDGPAEAHADAAASAPEPAVAAAAGHAGDVHADAHGAPPGTPQVAAHGGEAASAAPLAAAAAATSVVAITQEPPPRWPVTRASGPLVAIRLRLSDEAKAAARAEVAAARAAASGEAVPHSPAAATAPPATPAAQPTQGPGTPPRLGPQETAVRVAQQPGTVYAVVTPAMPQRESAEAILAQMMSVRARIPPPVPDHGEVMAHQGRWRAAWWPFATLAEAERARTMLVVRGMRAEVIEF